MEQLSVYHLSQRGVAKSKRINIIVMSILYGTIIAFLLYRISGAPFTWDKDLINIGWIAFCIGSPVYWYFKMAKQLRDTRLEIGDTGITIFTPARNDQRIGFGDVKLVNKIDHGLMLIHKEDSKKSVLITNKFESFEEIEAKIDRLLLQVA
jgi:hypothetical protein